MWKPQERGRGIIWTCERVIPSVHLHGLHLPSAVGSRAYSYRLTVLGARWHTVAHRPPGTDVRTRCIFQICAVGFGVWCLEVVSGGAIAYWRRMV